MNAWYFATTDRRLRYDDNREIKLGETHTVEGPPKLCENGLHASKSIRDAIFYAPGPVVYIVELAGEIAEHDDKCVATERTYLRGGIDITEILREFARKVALRVCNLIEAPEEDKELIKKYLETGDNDLREKAGAAARAASGAAEAAAALWAAEAAAAAEAARAAAALWAAERQYQEQLLESMVMEAIEKAERGKK